MSDLQTMRAVMRVWKNAQLPMTNVVRWGNFPAYGQILTEHNSSLPIVGQYVITLLRHHAPRFQFDTQLLYEAFALHDHGEPLTGGDEHAGAVTADKAVREWKAFFGMVRELPDPIRQRQLLAFTLQYVRKSCRNSLPADAFWVLNQIDGHYKNEAIIFEFCERLDYLFSALDGYDRRVRNKEEGMLEHCYANQAPKIGGLLIELPTLSHVWSSELREQLGQLAERDARGEYPKPA